MKTEFEREEFFNLCWEKSILWFCKNYLISYQEFKNTCTKYQIPLPPNGYWMKKKFNKEIFKPELPKTSDDAGKIHLVLRTKENSKKPKTAKKLKAIDSDSKSYDLEVPKRLSKNPDPIIQEMLSDNPRKHPIVNNIRDYTKRYNYGRIWVSASKKPYKRALCFLDTFIKVMKARGHYFLFCYERAYIVIEGIEIAIRMRERSKRVYEIEKSGYRSSKLVPIGLLSLITGEYSYEKEWQETPNKTLAEKLPLIIEYLEREAQRERKWKVENEKRLKKEAIEKKKQEERERLQKEEIEKLRFIKQKSDLWHEANKLRAFLEACNKNKNLTEEMKKLVVFGYQKVDWLDPLVSSKDELFEDLDPHKLLEEIK
ncbi:hypothetical protein [Salegentibacter sediminis]|uniref:hypothetical protein n=1 Tax=Salegentibacter sediminis TaxID=1930251 RepID=UPI0009BCC4CB|nr:hypothetical protein [Salegentibacter sediminis]